jgi:predicted ATPase/class 3 adenylate cyclase/tetratricopeptide (TPR) repeat protein
VIQFPRRHIERGRESVCFLIAELDERSDDRVAPGSTGDGSLDVGTLIGTAVAAQGGHIFKTIGTRWYAAFAAVGSAVATALQLQRSLNARETGAAVALRAGIHAGAAESVGDDYVGATLNRAARLTSIAHGEQVLVSAAAARLLDPAETPAFATIDRLGWYRLRDLLEPEAVHQLCHPDLRADFPPLRSLDTAPHNLPLLNSFCIGRNDELQELGTLLTENRHQLITVLGPGGVGKTRLVLQCGAENLAWFADGVWFVDVGVLSEGGQIAEALCMLLGFKFGGDRTAGELLPALLRHKRLMIIFDNCAHLAGQVGALATDLLRGCRDIAILATSLAPIGVAGERCLMLAGHSLPPAQPGTSLADALASPAVRLFLARARQAASDFKLTQDNVGVVVAICRRLDGMALAIELAAARLRDLSLHELLRSLEAVHPVAPAQHRSGHFSDSALHDVIEGSYELLTPNERVAFARLGVFGGCFTLDAAVDTIGMSPLRREEVPDVMASLLDKALLAKVPGWADENRYRLVDTVRRHALDKLARDAGRHDVMDRLCAWLIRTYGEAERLWPATRADEWLARYKCDVDNLRAALAWAFGTADGADLLPHPALGSDAGSGNTAAGLMLVSLTSELWRDLGMTAEQRHWLALAQPRIGPATPDRVAARIGLDIAFAVGGGAFGDRRNIDDALGALVRYKTIGGQDDIALAASRVAVCLVNPQDTTAARPYVDLIEAALPTMGRTRRRAWLLNVLAALVHFDGDHARAITLLDEAVAISRHYRDQVNIQIAGLNLGEFLFAQGDPQRAAAEATAVAASCRETGNLLDLAFTLSNLAAYALVLGDVPRARATLAEAVPLVADINIEFVLISCLQSAGLLCAIEGDMPNACRLAGHTRQFYESNALAREATEAAISAALTEALDQAQRSGSLSPALRDQLIAEGGKLGTKQAVGIALQRLAAPG